jgi:DNA-binding transcriptional LysR family regulator
VEELENHCGILYTNRSTDWRFEHEGGLLAVTPRRTLRVNNGLVMRDAAIAGMGLTLLPTFMMHAALASDALRVVDVGKAPERAELHIAHPRQQRPSAKLRALIDHLKASFGDPPYWDQPEPAG